MCFRRRRECGRGGRPVSRGMGDGRRSGAEVTRRGDLRRPRMVERRVFRIPYSCIPSSTFRWSSSRLNCTAQRIVRRVGLSRAQENNGGGGTGRRTTHEEREKRKRRHGRRRKRNGGTVAKEEEVRSTKHKQQRMNQRMNGSPRTAGYRKRVTGGEHAGTRECTRVRVHECIGIRRRRRKPIRG